MTMLQRRLILICWSRRDYHDSQVQYWEPAKWVAKLRELKTDDRLLLLCTDMDSGHGGKSGRYKSYEGVAWNTRF
ncbi:protease II [Citrobacter freundii]|nr:protease II [Citrobacter freundii]